MDNEFLEMAKNAKMASIKAQSMSSDTKNEILCNIAESLTKNASKIFEANKIDMEQADKLLKSGKISKSIYNRLELTTNKFNDMVTGFINISKLSDPVNKVLLKRQLDEGLTLYKVSCPIGVLGIIFEARPDVIGQITALAIKTSNAVILKGGKESINTNKAILTEINSALDKFPEFPKNMLNQVFTREDVSKMLECDKYIDLIIPRGGNSLVQFVKSNTNIPVLGHADGICHIFVDENTNIKLAERVIIDAKTQYPSACNSVETLLIHEKFAQKNELLKSLENAGIKLVSNPESWHKEYSDKILAYKTVKDVHEAIDHINEYGSGHTDSILTENKENAELFMNFVDSAGVYCNASTRFADGFRYGFGAEVGISTSKTHARGPVGIDGLVIYKYKLVGNGHIVAEYANKTKQFHYKDL